MRNILHNGTFQGIDANFVEACAVVLRPLAAVQRAYGKKDNERFIREWQHCVIAQCLNYDEVNSEKHGLSARRQKSGGYDFLAIKSASFLAKSWHATFNDTVYTKARLFKQDNIFLALAVWHGLDKLLFVAYGRNAAIGDFLAKGVQQHEAGETGREPHSLLRLWIWSAATVLKFMLSVILLTLFMLCCNSRNKAEKYRVRLW